MAELTELGAFFGGKRSGISACERTFCKMLAGFGDEKSPAKKIDGKWVVIRNYEGFLWLFGTNFHQFRRKEGFA